MQRAGSSSWRFAEEDAQLLHVALWVRDAGGLPVAAAPDVPPALTVPPAVSASADSAADEAHRVTAGDHWLVWWRSLVAAESTSRAAREALADAHPRDRMRAARAVLDAAFDPPAFTTLADAVALRQRVVAGFEDAVRASNVGGGAQGGTFAWATIRDCAEEVAEQRGVPIGRLQATASVLPVRGVWSHLTAPGEGLCSVDLARSDGSARTFLRSLFASALDR